MTLTLQNAPDTQGFLDALKNFLSQWQGVKIETEETQGAEEFDHYISDEEILSDPETLEAAKECEYILAHPEEYKAYHDVDEMFRDLLADEAEQPILEKAQNSKQDFLNLIGKINIASSYIEQMRMESLV